MEEKHILRIADELNITAKQVGAVALLLTENATVPFIARYRKEATGSLDEVVITNIRDRLEQLAELDKRREAILESLGKQGNLTAELKYKVMAAETMAVLEDIYLPFRCTGSARIGQFHFTVKRVPCLRQGGFLR
ncbi:MAG: hypothetical protein NT028_09430, partial [candidate division Zixibacteria bacterium]|nr:hypothetical protein [candidate division Zixibacteria bacterium]